MRRTGADSGFTLVELMTVLAISGVIMAAVSVSIRDIVRTNSARKLITEVQGEGRSGLYRLQEEIREASLGSQSGAINVFDPNTGAVEPRPPAQGDRRHGVRGGAVRPGRLLQVGRTVQGRGGQEVGQSRRSARRGADALRARQPLPRLPGRRGGDGPRRQLPALLRRPERPAGGPRADGRPRSLRREGDGS